MNNLTKEDYNEMIEKFVDFECLLQTATQIEEYTEEHYRLHMEKLQEIFNMFKNIKLTKVYNTINNRVQRPDRNYNFKTMEQKFALLPDGPDDGKSKYTKCDRCDTVLQRKNLKQHLTSNVCVDKGNLITGTISVKKIKTKLRLPFLMLGDKLDRFCRKHKPRENLLSDEWIWTVCGWRTEDEIVEQLHEDY